MSKLVKFEIWQTYDKLVSEALTPSMSATCFAPADPPMLLPVKSPLKSSSLSVLLPFTASQITLVPSSIKLFEASEILVSEAFAASAGAKASAPSEPMSLYANL